MDNLMQAQERPTVTYHRGTLLDPVPLTNFDTDAIEVIPAGGEVSVAVWSDDPSRVHLNYPLVTDTNGVHTTHTGNVDARYVQIGEVIG